MIDPWQYKEGLLETPKLNRKGIGLLQDMLTVWGWKRCFTWIAQGCFEVD